MIIGIYYVMLIMCKVQVNVDFYVGFFGFCFVKQMGGFEDVEQFYFFYGDVLGSFGFIVIFFVWEDGVFGWVGWGQISEFVFVVLL